MYRLVSIKKDFVEFHNNVNPVFRRVGCTPKVLYNKTPNIFHFSVPLTSKLGMTKIHNNPFPNETIEEFAIDRLVQIHELQSSNPVPKFSTGSYRSYH